MRRATKTRRPYSPRGLRPVREDDMLLVALASRDRDLVAEAYAANPSHPGLVTLPDGRRWDVSHRYDINSALVYHRLPTCQPDPVFTTYDDATLAAIARHCNDSPGSSLSAAAALVGVDTKLLRLSYLLSTVEAPPRVHVRDAVGRQPPRPTLDLAGLAHPWHARTGQDPVDLLTDRDPHRLDLLRDRDRVAGHVDGAVHDAGTRWLGELERRLFGPGPTSPWRTLLVVAVHGLGRPVGRHAPYDADTTRSAVAQLDQGGWSAVRDHTPVTDPYRLKVSVLAHGVGHTPRLDGDTPHVGSVTAAVRLLLDGTLLYADVRLSDDHTTTGLAAFDTALHCPDCGHRQTMPAGELLARTTPPRCLCPARSGADLTLGEWRGYLARQSADARLAAVQIRGQWYEADTLSDATPVPVTAAVRVTPGYAAGTEVTTGVCEIRRLRDVDELAFARYDRYVREARDGGVHPTVDQNDPAGRATSETCLVEPDHRTRRRADTPPRTLRQLARLEQPCWECQREGRLHQTIQCELDARNSRPDYDGEPAQLVLGVTTRRRNGRCTSSATILCRRLDRHLSGQEHISEIPDTSQMSAEPCGACSHESTREAQAWWPHRDHEHAEIDVRTDGHGKVTGVEVWHTVGGRRCPDPLDSPRAILARDDLGCGCATPAATAAALYDGVAQSDPEHIAAVTAVRWMAEAAAAGELLTDVQEHVYRPADARVICQRPFDGCTGPKSGQPLHIDVTVQLLTTTGSRRFVTLEIDGRQHSDPDFAWDVYRRTRDQWEEDRERDACKDRVLAHHTDVIAHRRIQADDDVARQVTMILGAQLPTAA